MPETYYDVNRLSGLPTDSTKKSDTALKPKPAPAPEPEKPKEKAPPEFKITECRIIVPSDGLKQNKPFDVEGSYEPSSATVQTVKITLDAVAHYDNHPDDTIASLVDAEVDQNKKTFKATVKSLYFHQEFLRDGEKSAGATFTLTVKAYGPSSENELVSAPVTLPMAIAEITLKKGHYDDAWSGAANHEKEYPKSGDNYLPGEKVKKLQENLIKFKYLDDTLATGYFGDLTENAVIEFQKAAIKHDRKTSKDRKIFQIDRATFTGAANGIVDRKTEDEVAVWFQKDYIKPDIEIYKNNFDEHGFQNGHGRREDQGYHTGYQVTEIERLLIGAGALIAPPFGFFGEAAYKGLKLFQKYVAKGELKDKKGNTVTLKDNEKLSGHREGVVCQKTKDSLQMANDRGLVVPKENAEKITNTYFQTAVEIFGDKKIPYVLGGASKTGADCTGLVCVATGHEIHIWGAVGMPPGSWEKIDPPQTSIQAFLAFCKEGDLFVWEAKHTAFFAGGIRLYHAQHTGTKIGYTSDASTYWLKKEGYPIVYRQKM